LIIVDAKSGQPSPWHSLQVAAYELAERENASHLITFDPVKHKYFRGQEEVPGVSTILRETGRQGTWSSSVPFYAQKGTYVHRAIELDCAGTLDDSTVDEKVRPYLDAWRDFRRDTDAVIVATERRVYHPTLNYAGTLDLIITLPNEGDVIAALLYLRKTGKYSWRPLPALAYTEAKAEWMKALTEYHAAKDDLWA